MRRKILSRSLSAKILLLTVACVLVGEVLIYLPSVARFRVAYLQERIAAAQLASLAASASGGQPDVETVDALLGQAGVLAVEVDRAGQAVMLGERAPISAFFDLTAPSSATLIADALSTLLHRGQRLIRVQGPSPQEMGTTVDIILSEAPMWMAMVAYSVRILGLSLALSGLVAAVLFLALQGMIVRPLRRITEEIAAFRSRPEDATIDRDTDPRTDEIGVVEEELATMRGDLRDALAEKTRLAALGAGMSRIGHDLRNILSTAILISDRLEASADPAVRKVAPRLIETLERAVRLCGETLTYARSGAPVPEPRQVRLATLASEIRTALEGTAPNVAWQIDLPPDLLVEADQDQLFRVVANLAKNAIEAMGERGGRLRLSAELEPPVVRIDVADTGPGIPPQVRERLFEPFAGSSKPNGNGLGLAICRELIRAHGGEIELVETSERGTVFRLRLPARLARRAPGRRRPSMPLENVVRVVLPLALLLAGCNYQGPAVAGYPGLQNRIQWYYDSNAIEQNATCTQPRMRSITGTQILQETPQNVVMNIRYYWFDEGQLDFDNDGFVPAPGLALQRCNGFAERQFTFVKMTDGSLQVRSMTGPQRSPSS